MDKKIKDIMQEYIKNVEDTCNILLEGINDSDHLNLRTKKDLLVYRMEKAKTEFEIRGISYRFHGKGCVAFKKDFFLDWDFGYRSRWCGIEPWKLAMTLVKNKSQYSEYYDGNLIKTICEQAVKDGIMFKQYEQYYFVIPQNETFEPKFPKEFDTLAVTNRDSTWTLPRNKVIDRFIRKSRWVYNKIDNNKDKYVLSFLLKEKEIYSISYDDIGYPEEAVKIMSDDILHNLLKPLIMFEKLDNLLKQNVTEDSWYDDGFLIAQDIMSNFSEDDWQHLSDVILSKDIEWQKKIVYCLDNQLIEEELNIICKLLQVEDNELLEMCIDSLRSFDNEVGHQFIKSNPQIIQMVKDKIKGAGIVEKKMLENFILRFDNKS